MTVTLKLEAIGDNHADLFRQIRRGVASIDRLHARQWKDYFSAIRQPWVAEIAGFDSRFGLKREFLDGQKDFSEANSVGSRGVCLYYHLREGRLYEIHELQTWSRSRRYFATVRGGALVEIEKGEVDALLNERMEREAGFV